MATTLFMPPRFKQEIVPIKVTEDWVQKCEPALLPEVARDHNRIRAHVFRYKSPAASYGEKKLYLATAGAPCSGKSTELDLELASGRDTRYAHVVFSDPDRGVMPYMFAYQDLLQAGMKARLGVVEASKQAYDRTRPGSNIIANLILNRSVDGGYSIAHGTTGTAPTFGPITLKNLGEMGYERRLLLVAAPDGMRVKAGEKRINVEAHYQVAPKDFVEKGKLFPQRHEDYFKYGDHLVILWKTEVEKPAIRAAEYKDGNLVLHDIAALGSYVTQYNKQRVELAKDGIKLPSWQDLEQTYFDRFNPPSRPVTTPGTTPSSPGPQAGGGKTS